MTQVRFSILHPIARFCAGFLLAVALAGCSGPSRTPPPTLASLSAPRPIAMKGEGRFFDGQVIATLIVSRGFERGMGGRGDRALLDKDETAQIYLPEPEDKDYAEAMGKIMALQVRGSPVPPVTLRLSLANQTKQPLEVEIVELNSDLGNFAVQPDHLMIGPEKSAEPDAMNSQLGATSAEIPVKLALRYGGKTESQVVLVKSLFTTGGKRE
jgi:hypothetical protein